MKYLHSLCFLILFANNANSSSTIIPQSQLKQFKKRWAKKYETNFGRIIKYPFRFLTGTVDYAISLNAVENAKDLVESGVHAVCGIFGKDKQQRQQHFEQAGWKLADSSLNALLNVESTASDAFGVISLFSGSVGPRTGRIKYVPQT